jgi:hypothetical protein
MTVTENNPHKISTMGTGTSLAAVTDASDFPHTGLIKGLSQMARQNIVVKGSNDSASHDFNITQATSGNVIQVAQGSYLRDGKLYTASAANFTIGTTSNDTSLLAHSQFDKGYHLLVINSSNAIKIRQPTVADKVPDYTSGDTIIAIIEVSSTTSDGSRKIQFLTSDKTDNSVSIAYTDSNTYTEALSISASAGDTTIENKVSDKDIIFKVNDGGSAREILRLDADDNEVRIVSTIDGAGMGPQLTLFRDTADADDNDLIGVISFKGEDSGNAETEYVRMVAQILDESNGTEDSQFFIRLMKAGSLVYPLKMTPTQTIFNAANEDIDVRIDGSADNLFYADSATDTVGIGTTPVANAKLTVQGVLALDEVSAPTNQSAYGQLYANADNDLHYMDGAGTDTPLLKGGKHTIWVPSSAMTPLTTNGCSALTQVEMTAGRPELQVLDFAAGADDFCQFTVAFPKSWNEGTVTFQPFWTVTGAKAHSGTSNDLNVSAESGALTITNASVDSVTFFRLNLKTSASSQTGTVRLVGLKLFYDINAGNDE